MTRHRRYLKPYKVFYTRPDGRTVVRGRDRSKVYWYRIVARNMLGRELLPGEEVHHRNGDQTDDRSENLEVLGAAEHHDRHVQARLAAKAPCAECGADRRNERESFSVTLCRRCYYRTPGILATRRRYYEANREAILEKRQARRARQRSLGLKVT